MEKYEEIIGLIKRWFGTVLETKVTSINDFDDGQLYLEALNKCDKIDIPKEKCQKFEALEIFMDRFFNMKTNAILDYENMVFDKAINVEDVICVCVLVFGVTQSYNRSPTTLSQNDYQLLLILYRPIGDFLKNGVKLDRNKISEAISKIADFDDCSYISRIPQSSNGSVTETTQNLGDYCRKIDKTSDDEMENSFNIPSTTSETSYARFQISNRFSNHESVSDLANHEDGKESFKCSRRIKGTLNHRKMNNQLIFYSPNYNRKIISSKATSEIRKQEAKRISKIEADNKDLKEELYELQAQLADSNSKYQNLQDSMKKFQLDHRKLKDNMDECETQIADKDQNIIRKDKELERLTNLINQGKKETNEKNDEIIQMKITNKELHRTINSLKDKIQSTANTYDEIKMTEIEYLKKNEDLKNENQRLKSQFDEYKNEFRSMSDRTKADTRDDYVESPLPNNVEEGENMAIISEFKFAEMEEKYKIEIRNLKAEIESNNQNIHGYKSEFEVLDQKYKEALSEIRIFSEKLDEAGKKNSDDIDHKAAKLPDIKEMRFQSIVEMLKDLLAGNQLLMDERKLLVKFIGRELNVDFHDDERCQAEMDSLYKNLSDLKQSNDRKVREYESLQNHNEDLGQHFQIISDELESEKLNAEELTRHYQVQKAKLDDDIFKAKMTINNVLEEKNALYDKYCDLKREFIRCENSLEKSNDEFNSLREAYDKCLQSLKELSEDCHDYEEVIKEITAREQKIYRNISCQTEQRLDIASTGTNVMSPRTPNILNRNQSLRKPVQSRQYGPESANVYKQSPHITMSNNIVANKSLHALRQTNQDTYNVRKTIDGTLRRPDHTFDSRIYGAKPEHRPLQKYADQSTYHNQSFERTPQHLDKKLIKGERYPVKKDSPLVKPDRLNQIWSRNDRQPAHLKSSYPVETQGVDVGYVASVYFDSMKVPLDDSEADHDMGHGAPQSGRPSSSRHYTNVDPMNFRSDMRNRGLYQYNDSVLVDDLLKHNTGTGILSARSMNSPRNDSFRKPTVPQLKLAATHDMASHRDSDRENRRPDYDDQCSVTSSSISFNIQNSPRAAKIRGFPRPSGRRDGKR